MEIITVVHLTFDNYHNYMGTMNMHTLKTTHFIKKTLHIEYFRNKQYILLLKQNIISSVYRIKFCVNLFAQILLKWNKTNIEIVKVKVGFRFRLKNYFQFKQKFYCFLFFIYMCNMELKLKLLNVT